MKFFLFLISFCVFAEYEYKGELLIGYTHFSKDEVEETTDQYLDLEGKLGLRFEGSRFKAKSNLRSLYSADGDKKSFILVEDLIASYLFLETNISLGLKSFNQSAMDVFRPVDVVNSRVLVNSIKEVQKRGEPFIGIDKDFGNHNLFAYYLPRVEKVIFPNSKNRLNLLPEGFNWKEDIYLDEEGKERKSKSADQFYIGTEGTFEGVDYLVAYLEHVDRSTPQVIVNPFSLTVQPVYFTVSRFLLSLQSSFEDYVYRFEASYNNFTDTSFSKLGQSVQVEDNTQYAMGLDYSYEHSNGYSSYFTVEYQSFFNFPNSKRRSLGIFQNDILLGYRLGLNDILNKELSFYIINDLGGASEQLLSLSYSQRLNDYFKFFIDIRAINADKAQGVASGLESYADDRSISTSLNYFF